MAHAAGPFSPFALPFPFALCLLPAKSSTLRLHTFGLRIGVRFPRVLESRVIDRLPPGWVPARGNVDRWFEVTAPGDLPAFEADLQIHVATYARGRVFVHAGVVGWQGEAILLPGATHAGKTTLVVELVKAGATYYSDEYAVLSAAGRVYPYARRPHVRAAGGRIHRPRFPAGEQPLRVGLIVATQYRVGRTWRPSALSRAEALMTLLANTVPARLRPAAVMAALQRTVAYADGLAGVRGEAARTASAILDAAACAATGRRSRP